MTDNNEEFYTARGYEIIADDSYLTPSMEDYIEMIYRMSNQQDSVRVNDLADKLNVQPPSVTKMMKRLRQKKLLNYERYGVISLTDAGKNLGKFYLERHNILKGFLAMLGIQNNIQQHVEQMEHYVNWETLHVIRNFVMFLQDNQQVLKNYQEYVQKKG